jgi:hypothetical protein
MAGENNNNLSVEIRANMITKGTVMVDNHNLVNPVFSFESYPPSDDSSGQQG